MANPKCLCLRGRVDLPLQEIACNRKDFVNPERVSGPHTLWGFGDHDRLHCTASSFMVHLVLGVGLPFNKGPQPKNRQPKKPDSSGGRSKSDVRREAFEGLYNRQHHLPGYSHGRSGAVPLQFARDFRGCCTTLKQGIHSVQLTA